LIETAAQLSESLPERTVCFALGASRSTLRRLLRGPCIAQTRRARHVPRQLSDDERATILALLHSDRFADLAVPQVVAQLLDEGRYLCSESTMYRLLRANAEVLERRRIARHPEYRKPELLATGPRQVLSWDITKIRGPEKGIWYSLLVMLDIFSRYIVGWCVVRRSNAKVAEHFVSEIVEREKLEPGQVIIHNDRGTEMTAETFCAHLDALGITRSSSRPHVSNDNPFSEAAFKTLNITAIIPNASAPLRMRGHSFAASFRGTILNIATRGSRCLRRQRFTMVRPISCSQIATPPCSSLTRLSRNDSSTASRSYECFHQKSGSTDRRMRTPRRERTQHFRNYRSQTA